MTDTLDSLPARKHRVNGWKRDIPDCRDRMLGIARTVALPTSVDLRAHCPPVYNQFQLGSCTANAIGAALQFERERQGLTPDFVPSRLFIYYGERVIEGTVDEDSGAEIRDGMKVVSKLGAPPETDWPYIADQFAVKPPVTAYTDALSDRALKYYKVAQAVSQFQSSLAGGYPIVFGFTVYESFESDQVAQTGEVPMPGPTEQVLGGHAVMMVGYDNSTNRVLVRNSWGADWGMGGYFTMPYDYVTDPDLASDFWTIRLVSNK